MDNTERQRLVDRYVQILDEEHLDELDPILEAAQRDPELSKMIAVVSRGYAEADGRTLGEEERSQIRRQLREAVGRLAQAERVDDHDPDGSANGDAGDGASAGHSSFGVSSQAEQADLQSPAHGQTFLRLIVSSTKKQPTKVAPHLNATTSFIDDANDYPDVVGPNVVHRLVTTAQDIGVDALHAREVARSRSMRY